MRTRRRLMLALSAAMLAATSAAPLLAQDKGGGEGSVTLSLAVWDQPGRQAEQAALDLVALAPELSGGAITVSEPLWGMVDAADLVRSGQVDLAILATREWSPHGVMSLDALEAPFLIEDDQLAVAVATSDVADAAMAGLADLGVTGLAMWPEDLRHLFSFEPFGRAFTTLEDFSGSTILAIAGQRGQELITTLGGVLYQEGVETETQTGDREFDSQSGALDGMVTGLWGAGLSSDQIDGSVVAGDVVLFPKYQMLVANRESLARLSEEERAALDEITDEVHRLALDRHFTEAELAASICESGGTVVEAGEEAVAELRAAALPLTDALAADPVIGDLMSRIRQLAAQTPDDGGAGTCAPAGGVEDAVSRMEPALTEALAGFTGSEFLPDGTYRAVMVADELEAAGADRFFATINDGTWTLTISGDGWQAAHDGNRASPSQPPERCEGTQQLADGSVRLTTVVSRGCGLDYDVRWSLDGDAMTLRLADLAWAHTAVDFANEQKFIDRVWTRIDGPTGSDTPGTITPPGGTYRADITVEDLEARGIDHESAVGNAGIVTMMIQGPEGAIGWDSGASAGSVCRFTITTDSDGVRFVFPSGYCTAAVYELTFAVEGDRLIPSVISTMPASDLALTRAFFERDWTRIANDESQAVNGPVYPISHSAGFSAAPPPGSR